MRWMSNELILKPLSVNCRIQVKPLSCHVQTEVSTSHLWGENSLFAALKGFVYREQLNKTSWVLWVLHYVGDTPAASLSVDCATNLLETDWPPKQHRWRGWQYNLVRTLFFENRHLLVSKGPETARRQTVSKWNKCFCFDLKEGVCQFVLCRETTYSQGTTE